MATLFEPFRRRQQPGDYAFSGSGLGLSICRKLVEAMGSNLYLETAASGAPIAGNPGENGLGTLRQGYLEESSVDAVREITELIEAQRGYELNSKVISAADQMLGATSQVR
jgi:flagellar basal-body rod protein FlgG